MLKASDLLTVWSAPDNSRLTSKQYSFRLPVHVAAKISALEEMYPNRTRTEIVGDLLSSALAEVERSFPSVAGESWEGRENPDTGAPLFYDVGPGARFRSLANRHFQAIEREMGTKSPPLLYDGDFVIEGKKG